MIRDRNIDWARKRVTLEALQGMGWYVSTTVVGLHTGDPDYVELSTFGVGAVQFAQEGDEWCQMWELPKDLDVHFPIYFKVKWSSESTAEDGATFILTYHDAGIGEALAAADTALSTPLVEDTHTGTAFTVNKTEAGVIAADTLSDGDTLVLETEIHATDATIGSEYIYFLGLEIEYTPKKTLGDGKEVEAQA
jgi:hypothetical protein